MFFNFNNLRPDQYWKFFTDFKYWDMEDPEIFDKQYSPGYFRNCSIALWWMLQSLGRPVDLDYIIALRNLAYHSDPKSARGLALNVHSGLGEDSFSSNGLKQLMEEERQADIPIYSLYVKTVINEYDINLYDKNFDDDGECLLERIKNQGNHIERMGLKRVSDHVEEIINIATLLLEQYQKEIQQAKSDDSKLTAVVKVIQKLHQFHLFPDGNGRTFCFFLLNRLLLDNDLLPTIVANPANFTGWSVKELVKEVKRGQERFHSLCSPLEMSLIDTIERRINLTLEEKNQFFSSQFSEQNEQLFEKAIKYEDKQQQINILEKMLPYERVLLVKKQSEKTNCTDEQKRTIQDFLERLRLLQWCGYENDALLFKASLHCHSTLYLKELLFILHDSSLANDSDWKQFLSHLILENNKNMSQALGNAIHTALIYKNQPWFDMKRYINMLMNTSEHITFNAIERLYLSINWPERSLTLIKKYIYQLPKDVNKLFSIIQNDLHNEMQKFYRPLLTPPILFDGSFDPLNFEPKTKHIYLYIRDNHLWYKTKYKEVVIDFELEERLLYKISPEVFTQLKTLIQKSLNEKSLSEKHSVARIKLNYKSDLSLFSRIENIDPNLPNSICELVGKDDLIWQNDLSNHDLATRRECDQLLAVSKKSKCEEKKETTFSQYGSFFEKPKMSDDSSVILRRAYGNVVQ